MELKKMPLWQMTGEELIALLKDNTLMLSPGSDEVPSDVSKRYVYGLSGLQQLLGCCHSTAQKIKDSGKINGCYTQIGRKLIFDADAVLHNLKQVSHDQ